MGNYTRTGYHSRHPSWRDSRDLVGNFIGIELECLAEGVCESSDWCDCGCCDEDDAPENWDPQAYRKILEAVPDFPEAIAPLMETDGSLPNTHGVEIIFPPVSYTQLKSRRSVVARTMQSLRSVVSDSFDTDEWQVGMHLNVNTNGWTQWQVAAFMATIDYLDKEKLEALGGRELNGYCGKAHCTELLDYLHQSDHSYTVECRDKRVELRFPGTTTDHNRVRALVDFIYTVQKFVFKQEDLELYEYHPHKLADRYLKSLESTRRGRYVKEVMDGKHF